ncbi:MAG: CDP-diacylglycerol--glycerol-3-phosphate 3-phosphatidyltransferase [Ruminococcaceae bacterium]|nr:CDP-diacylglycerol--glycerol-3-phosphate 3-phosphatidyltransferase [Oscillospiraceae bacterium]
MNTPNKLTLLRIILVPLFMVFMLSDFIYGARLFGTIVFVVAFFTDWADGYLARKNGQVTDFGKIMDPLADKMLVTAALACLTAEGTISPWVVVIILAREFIVSGIRITAAAEGNVIAASIWGKAKTMWQFVALTLALLFGSHWFVTVCIWLAVVLTVVSGIDYIKKNAGYLSMK